MDVRLGVEPPHDELRGGHEQVQNVVPREEAREARHRCRVLTHTRRRSTSSEADLAYKDETRGDDTTPVCLPLQQTVLRWQRRCQPAAHIEHITSVAKSCCFYVCLFDFQSSRRRAVAHDLSPCTVHPPRWRGSLLWRRSMGQVLARHEGRTAAQSATRQPGLLAPRSGEQMRRATA